MGFESRVDTLAYSPDGKRLYLGGGSYTDHGEPGDVKVWDTATGKELGDYKGFGRIIGISPDGRRVASGEFYGSLKIWDANTGETLVTFGRKHTGVHALAFSPDGKTLVSGSNRNGLKIWDAEKGIELRSIDDFKTAVDQVVFSPDGRFLVSAGIRDSKGSSGGLVLWDTNTWEQVRRFEGHKSGVFSAIFTPAGKQLISGSWDKSIKIWDVSSGREIATLNGHTHAVRSVALGLDGRIVSGSYDGTIRLWDAQSYREVLTLQDGGHYVAVNPSRPEFAGTGKGVRIWSISE